jgi:glycosyltransferase involved in cell wall biosynthesis
MKIAFFTSLYMPDIGGAEILLKHVISGMVSRGHNAVLIAPRKKGKTSQKLSCPVVRTLRPISKRYFLHHTLPSLLYAKARYGFDLVHCHGEYREPYVAATLKHLTGTPFVVRPVGGGFATIRENPELRPRLVGGLSQASGVIAQGEFLKGQILGAGVEESRIVTINNGVRPEEILVEGASPRTRPFIFYVGGLRPVKGYDILLRAFAKIAKEIHPVQLVMAGTAQHKDEFLRLRHELGLSEDAVQFVGFLDRHTMALLYRDALLYVCPFRQSPFSNANLEAMTAGCPVVATAVDGNTEQIRDGLEGRLVPNEDVDALATAMRQICLDPSLRQHMSSAALERAQHFTWEAMMDKYEHFYASQLGLGDN